MVTFTQLYFLRKDIVMTEDKLFLTYNQQMKHLRNHKKIDCHDVDHKRILVRTGYFNLINGYKNPFICGQTVEGEHIYIRGTNIDHLYEVKCFDDELRSFLLKYITQVEEEVRTLTGYKFDECNKKGVITWYDTNAYNENTSLQERMNAISSAYSELSKSHLDYVKFYMKNHKQIPTWIMIKVVNFSTFIEILKSSKQTVTHSICRLYGMLDSNQLPNVKLLIGSLHWLRIVRNSCAHNERIYCINRASSSGRRNSGRILEKYFSLLPNGYQTETDQKLFDLIVYLKYYLPSNEYNRFVDTLYNMLTDLQEKIHSNAFDYIRGHMGIRNISDLLTLKYAEKEKIDYNKFNS